MEDTIMPVSRLKTSVPDLMPLNEFLKLKRPPRTMPLLFLTNAQWRAWERKFSKAKQASAKLKGKDVGASAPKVRIEATPVPSLKGHIVHFVGATARVKVSVWRDPKFPLCWLVGVRLPRLRWECGLVYWVCRPHVSCAGNCPEKTRYGMQLYDGKCIPVWETIPEKRRIVGCRCIYKIRPIRIVPPPKKRPPRRKRG